MAAPTSIRNRLIQGSVIWAIFLTLLFLLFRFVGERHALVAALLYVPNLCWVAPAWVITLPLLIRPTRGGIALATLQALLTFYALDWRWNWPTEQASGPSLQVYTFNIGQSGDSSQHFFIEKHQPEILAFQEVGFQGRQKIQAPPFDRYPFRSHLGEFALLSEHPIVSQRVILGRSGPFAVHYHLNYQGRWISVYSLHLKSPRRTLKNTRDFQTVLQSLRFTVTQKGSDPLSFFWKNQRSDVQLLRHLLEHDPLPFLVMGDTNAPTSGKIHQELIQNLTDVHESVGWGAGQTFPGRSPLFFTGYGPWMRLDKILVSSHFIPQSIAVEPDQASQHRSVSASLSLSP